MSGFYDYTDAMLEDSPERNPGPTYKVEEVETHPEAKEAAEPDSKKNRLQKRLKAMRRTRTPAPSSTSPT